VNYVFVFYNAMIIFAKKHFSTKNAKTFSFLINLAIYLRAGMALVNRFVKRILFPLFDVAGSIVMMFLVAQLYQNYTEIDFEEDIIKIALPVYAIISILSVYLSGGYDKPLRLFKNVKGVAIGLVILLIFYGLLAKEYQFSRAFIFLSSFAVLAVTLSSRFLVGVLKIGGYSLIDSSKRKFVVVGDLEESERIKPLLNQTVTITHYATIAPFEESLDSNYQATLNQLADYIYINKIDEVIFCAKNLTSQQIIAQMSSIKTSNNVDFKIAQPDSLFLIGSNSIHTAGDLYLLELNTIATPQNKRNKRIFDVIAAVALLAFSPFVIWIIHRKLSFLSNIFLVLIGKKTWVGYSQKLSAKGLPKLKTSVLKVSGDESQLERIKKQQIIYAKDYGVALDLKILIQFFRNLGD